jgi:hypothetical protein
MKLVKYRTAILLAGGAVLSYAAAPYLHADDSASTGTGGSKFLNQMQKSVEEQQAIEARQAKERRAREEKERQARQAREAQEAQRKIASEQEKSEAAAKNGPAGTQIAFMEVTPTLGTAAIGGKSNFTLGSNLSFRIAPHIPFFFEPSVYLTFYSSNPNNKNGTIWAIDAGMRYDFMIQDSALVPFLKAAVGPSITSNSTLLKNDGTSLGSSYLNAFLGGGVKLLISQHVGARLDAGGTLQDGDFGLYFLASAVLPL